MSDVKVIYSDSDLLFTVKTTGGRGSRSKNIPTPKKLKYKIDLYLKDNRTFSYILPARFCHFNDEEALNEAIIKTALYLYSENPSIVFFPKVRYCVISACYGGETPSGREKWECCYWSNGKSETADLSSCIIDFINSSVDRTAVNWDTIMRKVVRE